MKKTQLFIFFVILSSFCCCGGGELPSVDGDGEVGENQEIDSIPCASNSDCLGFSIPMMCYTATGYCGKIECYSDDSCFYWFTSETLQNLQPLMVCNDGLCAKRPCNDKNDCDYTYPIKGPFECRDDYCQRLICTGNDDCPSYSTCSLYNICKPCTTESSTSQGDECQGNVVVHWYTTHTERCVYKRVETVKERCADGTVCKAEVDYSIPEHLEYNASCVPVDER